MVVALDSRLSGSGSRPGQKHCDVFLGKRVLLSTEMYKLKGTGTQGLGERYGVTSHLMIVFPP